MTRARSNEASHTSEVQLSGEEQTRAWLRKVLALPTDPTWMPREGLPSGGRAECEAGERPCPFVRCRHHLWRVDGPDRRGIRRNGVPPGTTIAPRWLEYPTPPSCALDVAEAAERRGEHLRDGARISYPQLAELLGLSADAVGRHVRAALAHVKRLSLATEEG
jgi:hypothetical protein